MRILRSQYLKYKTQQSIASKTTTLTALHDANQVRHTTSKKTKLDSKSIQTLTQATRTTVRHSSLGPLKDTSTPTLHRRNSNISLNNKTTHLPVTIQTSLPSGQLGNKSSKCFDNPATPSVVQQRRQTVACASGEEFIKQQVLNALKIKLLNTPYNRYTRINLVVRFYDEGEAWYTRFYRSYQNQLWLKMPRNNGGNKKQKWYFKCEVCQKKLCSFLTLKSHLNIHMGFFPHRCENCPKQYSAKKSLSRHTKTKHAPKDEV